MSLWQITQVPLLAGLVVASCATMSDRGASDVPSTVVDFISHLVAVFPASTGTSVSFRGRFEPIPHELESQGLRYLPDVRFQVAEIEFTHWGPEPVKLLIASDRTSGRVMTYLWSLWFTSPTSSLSTILQSRPWTDQAEFREACVALSKLVAFGMDGRTGQVGLEPAEPGKFLSLAKITIELFDRHGRLWRVMRVHFQTLPESIAPSFIDFEQTPNSGGVPFTSLIVAPNNRMQATAGGSGVAGAREGRSPAAPDAER